MPAPGYKWSETAKLNHAIRDRNRSRSSASVWADFDSGYKQILQIVEALPPDQLLRAGRFHWTGKHPLTTYLGANTASHYRFATKVVKRWLKGTMVFRTGAEWPNKVIQRKSALRQRRSRARR
jgi:hypothetical protein